MLLEITTMYRKYSKATAHLLGMEGSSSPFLPKLVDSLATRVPTFNDYSN